MLTGPGLRLHSYVVDHDYGFAPNPFHGVCTLATCKPMIRKHAAVGDYVIGTGCAKRGRRGYLVYYMRVDETSHFDAYWTDPRFRNKRPLLRGSKKQGYGDNIYHHDRRTGIWKQEDSFHSRPGRHNVINLEHDTGTTDRVLMGRDFAYWGGAGPKIPERFRSWAGLDICAGRGHRNQFPQEMIVAFVRWLRGLNQNGFVGRPLDWERR